MQTPSSHSKRDNLPVEAQRLTAALRDDIKLSAFQDSQDSLSALSSPDSKRSAFQDSLDSLSGFGFGSSFRDLVDNTIAALKENVDSELESASKSTDGEETSIKDKVKLEKQASLAQMMDMVEFRRLKQEMRSKGMVTSGAVNQCISQSIGRRASASYDPSACSKSQY